MTSRHYCLTFFNEPELKDGEYLHKDIRYLIVGKETCPTTQKVHWQAYIELNRALRMAGIKKIFNDTGLHIEPRRGTREQARDYCKKENQYTEYGKWISGQGHRSDLDKIVKDLTEGKKLSEVMIEDPKTYCQYRNGLKDIAASVTKSKTKEFRNLEVILITGPTGCGKTREAMLEAEYRIQGTQLQWWQDYDQEEVICIDEYSNDVKVTELLNILDGYQLRLNVKGSHTYANWRKVYITTNLRVDELHKDAKEAHRDALFRRITTIKNLWPNCDEEVHG